MTDAPHPPKMSLGPQCGVRGTYQVWVTPQQFHCYGAQMFAGHIGQIKRTGTPLAKG